MPRFHFHLSTGGAHEVDEDGLELLDAGAAYLAAVSGARGMCSELARDGENAMACAFLVTDGEGRRLFDVTFEEALGELSPRRRKVVDIELAIGRNKRLRDDLGEGLKVARRTVEDARTAIARSRASSTHWRLATRKS